MSHQRQPIKSSTATPTASTTGSSKSSTDESVKQRPMPAVPICRLFAQAVRSRRSALLLLLILGANLAAYLLFRPFPRFESFVHNANRRIRIGVSGAMGSLNGPADSDPAAAFANVATHVGRGGGQLEADEAYLEYLGLLGGRRSGFGRLAHEAGSLGFVVASGVSTDDYVYALDLLASVRSHLNDTLLVLYDTGLRTGQLNQLRRRCNATTRCRIRPFDFDKFPAHVRHTGTSAYKPLAIQMLLRDYGGLIWTDLRRRPYYFVVDSAQLQPTLDAARRVGIQAWKIPPPASSLTHPQTFSYLKADPSDFYFLRMVASAHLVLYYSEFLHSRVMLPWVRCALNADCWQPLGAHQFGCDFNRPPYFRYSGCHFYDMSALNVVLGLAFNYNVSAYECRSKVFGFGANDTSLSNHYHVPGLDFDELRMRAGVDPVRVVS